MDQKVGRTLLKIIHHFIIIVGEEGNRNALLASSTRTTCVEDQEQVLLSQIRLHTDAMNISFNRICHLEVDDQGDIGHIDTSTG